MEVSEELYRVCEFSFLLMICFVYNLGTQIMSIPWFMWEVTPFYKYYSLWEVEEVAQHGANYLPQIVYCNMTGRISIW